MSPFLQLTVIFLFLFGWASFGVRYWTTPESRLRARRRRRVRQLRRADRRNGPIR